jgi:hypothetical protein
MEETSQIESCKDGIHEFPDAEFEVGARVCLKCGAKEY